MKDITFSQRAKTIKQDLNKIKFKDLGKLENKGILWSYFVVSSNLLTFLPHIKPENHYKIVKDIQYHRSLSEIDITYPSLIKKTKVYDKYNVVESCFSESYIFVSYHAGSYNLFIRHLANKNVPFCVVANNDYLEKHKITAQKLYSDVSVQNKTLKNLQLFSAEDPKLLLKLIRKLREGVSVYIFIDGNSGTKKNDFNNDKNLLKINFLGHHIYARQGVALLAYLSKSSIATIIAKRNLNLNNTIKVNLIKTNKLIKKYNRNDFVSLITKKLYKDLESFLKNNYEQWSGWFYIHNFFNTEELTENITFENKKFSFGTKKFIINEYYHLIKYDDENIFIVMKNNYRIEKIEKYLYEVLTYFEKPKIITSEKPLIINYQKVSWGFLKELIELNYIKLL